MTATALLDIGIPKKNVEGYPCPTCYRALKAIQRGEYGYRPLVYICSPYSGDVEANIVLVQRVRGVSRPDSAHPTSALPVVQG